jgi:Domain of unknown function (DUF6458)
MALGTGIFLIVAGAILSWGVSDHVANVNFVVIGYILMSAGVVALVLSMWLNAQRSRTTHHEVVETKAPVVTPPPPSSQV